MFDWIYWLIEFESRAPRLVVERVPRDSVLTSEERARIADSIGTFQLGEQSEGRTLLRFAREFGARNECPALGRITELFIREEQHHAAQLREFMLAHGITLKERNWTDSIFRQIRRLAGFETAVTILVTAEMVGFVYYRALGRATQNLYLRTICRRMCADEAIHLRYEAQLLRTLRGQRPRWRRAAVEMAHRALLVVAARVVFREHRGVLEFAGHDAKSFRRDCASLYRTVLATRPSGRRQPGGSRESA
jgi:rubrerythrin